MVKKLLIMNYVYVVVFIAVFIKMTVFDVGRDSDIASLIGRAMPVITLILSILFISNKVSISKGLVMTLNVFVGSLMLAIIFAVPSLSGDKLLVMVPALFLISLPYIVNVFMLFRDRYLN